MNVPQRDSLQTTTEEIFVFWSGITGSDTGNSPILSYSLEYDAGTNG
jgi:hypothetical protein